MRLLDQVRTAARANRLANERLHVALGGLTDAEFRAHRAGFFPSLAATLDHILAVDGYYLDALQGVDTMAARFHAFVPCADAGELTRRQRVSDERLIAHVDSLSEGGLDTPVVLDRGATRAFDPAGHVLEHLFMHQTHHRGQAHAMLSSTAVPPPQLDEFLLPSDAPHRAADLRRLGWQEHDLFATSPAA